MALVGRPSAQAEEIVQGAHLNDLLAVEVVDVYPGEAQLNAAGRLTLKLAEMGPAGSPARCYSVPFRNLIIGADLQVRDGRAVPEDHLLLGLRWLSRAALTLEPMTSRVAEEAADRGIACSSRTAVPLQEV